MKFALILMIRNEEKIIKRCLEAVENVVDCFCVCDTGSTDKTVEIVEEFLKTHKGCLTTEPWKNFGHNRTVSFQNAQTYVRDELKWDLKDTYGLLLDADMIFVPNVLKLQKLTEVGYNIVQINGALEYNNCRLVRMDYNWKCIGVTHEYWDGPTVVIPREVCYINDRDDGGCKHDKFERDRRLLEQGIQDEPKNVRYMFYLAQTYKCLGMIKDAIQMYKKRIAAGGWDEEIWYSHYMIGEMYLAINNIPKFEYWMQKAYKYRSSRAEPIYKLVQYYRTIGEHYKSYHYLKVGRPIPYPGDSLFVEGPVYRGLFDYEASILDYYIHSDKSVGLRDSMIALLKTPDYGMNIISNIKFYTNSIASNTTLLNLPRPFGDVFTPSAISVCEYPYANVRYVNYRIQPDGSYTMPNGIVETKNAYVNLETNEYVSMKEPVPVFDSHIRGLEDLRLSKYKDTYYFTATSYKQYIRDKVSIVHGEYDVKNGEFLNYRGIQSPFNQECEKNWVCFPNTDTYLYSWHPLRFGKIVGNEFKTAIQYNTPAFFSHVRGSAPPVRRGDNWLVLVHFVEYSTPRKYYHCFVELDSSFKPLRMSLPFYFRENQIEFCISCGKKDENTLVCFTSMNDCSPARVEIPISNLSWIDIETKSPTTIVKPAEPSNCELVRIIPEGDSIYWWGKFSKCYVNGAIEKYLHKVLNSQPTKTTLLFPKGDGNIDMKEYESILSRRKENTIPIITSLSSRTNYDSMLYVPLDDETFERGLEKQLETYTKPKWEDRKPIAFWRGCLSGYDKQTLREKVVRHLARNEYADVKCVPRACGEKSHLSEYEVERCPFEKHFEHKYLLIVDGNTLASNHQWVFGSGAVPIMITHPDNMYWFSKFLKPMKNYVPVKYDLSDLDEKIEWLVQNDDKAKEIAENALKFSKIVFSPDFQRCYLEGDIKRILSQQDNLTINYLIKKDAPSDINEHLPTLYEYAKKCDSIVECGVRNPTSSYAFACGLLNNKNNVYKMIDPWKSPKVDDFLKSCNKKNINVEFIEKSDLECSLYETDLLFIDTWHVYGQLKRELARWNTYVKKYIIMHDTTVDEWHGETIRCGMNAEEQSKQYGIPVEEINKGLWPAIDEFLKEHPEWNIERRFTNNNGLTILARL